jgi:chromate transporter
MTTAPDLQRFMVGERGWISDAQFTASVALAQATPGPNVLFVSVLGWVAGGPAGALSATVGSLLPSALVAVAAGRFGERHRDSRAVLAFRHGMAPLTIGLLLATGWVLTEPTRAQIAMPLLAGATALVMLRTRINPLWPVAFGAVLGALGRV